MSCFPELTYSVYLDGELPSPEAQQVELHLESCTRCRTLVDSLRRENSTLTQALVEIGPEEQMGTQPIVEPPTRPLDVIWTGLAVLGAALGLRFIWDVISSFEAPTGADWLNPFGITAQWNLFFSSLFYLVQEGAAMLFSNLVAVSAVLVTLLGLGAVAFWLRRRPAAVGVLATLGLILWFASPAHALDIRKANRITIAAHEVVEDTLLLHAETIQVDGTVNGSILAFCGKTIINGTVTGDLITFTETLDVNGTVEGNVFAFTEAATVAGRTAGMLATFAKRVDVKRGGTVSQDLLAFTSEATIDGTVERDVLAMTGATIVTGSVGRHLRLKAKKLTLSSSARVGGNLQARVKDQREVEIDPAATIAGAKEIKLPEPQPSRYTRPKWYFWQAVWLAAAFLTGMLLYWLLPFLYESRSDSPRSLLLNALWGFVALVAFPIAAIILAITLVGLPISLISLAAWGTSLYAAHILVAAFVGRSLVRARKNGPAAFALSLLVGLLIVRVATSLPYIGGWLSFLVCLLGLGMVVTQTQARWRTPQPA